MCVMCLLKWWVMSDLKLYNMNTASGRAPGVTPDGGKDASQRTGRHPPDSKVLSRHGLRSLFGTWWLGNFQTTDWNHRYRYNINATEEISSKTGLLECPDHVAQPHSNHSGSRWSQKNSCHKRWAQDDVTRRCHRPPGTYLAHSGILKENNLTFFW